MISGSNLTLSASTRIFLASTAVPVNRATPRKSAEIMLLAKLGLPSQSEGAREVGKARCSLDLLKEENQGRDNRTDCTSFAGHG